MIRNKFTIDFRLFQKFGLSLNANNKYFIVYESFEYSLIGVYNNLEDAVKCIGLTLEEYYEKCSKSKDYNPQYIGQNFAISRGFFQNISVWELLHHLNNDIRLNLCFDKSRTDDEIIYDVLQKIDSNLKFNPVKYNNINTMNADTILDKLNKISWKNDINEICTWSLEEKKKLLEVYKIISDRECYIFKLIYSLHGCDSYEDIFRDYDGRYLDDKTVGVDIALKRIDSIENMNDNDSDTNNK